MSILDKLQEEFGVEPPSAEEDFYKRLVASGMMFNIQHWFKCDLALCADMMQDKLWLISKPHKEGRRQVAITELARFLLERILLMSHHHMFHGEETLRRGKRLDMNKTLDFFMNHQSIKKLVDDPRALV